MGARRRGPGPLRGQTTGEEEGEKEEKQPEKTKDHSQRFGNQMLQLLLDSTKCLLKWFSNICDPRPTFSAAMLHKSAAQTAKQCSLYIYSLHIYKRVTTYHLFWGPSCTSVNKGRVYPVDPVVGEVSGAPLACLD